MAYDPTCPQIGDSTECQCGKTIELHDAGVMGWYWAHMPALGRAFGLTSCDPEDPTGWLKGEEYSARPKGES